MEKPSILSRSQTAWLPAKMCREQLCFRMPAAWRGTTSTPGREVGVQSPIGMHSLPSMKCMESAPSSTNGLTMSISSRLPPGLSSAMSRSITIGIDRDMAELSPGGNRELIDIVKPFVEEGADSMHFIDGNECIPIGDCTPTSRPGVEVVPRQAAGIRKQSCSRHIFAGNHAVCDLLRIEGFSI